VTRRDERVRGSVSGAKSHVCCVADAVALGAVAAVTLLALPSIFNIAATVEMSAVAWRLFLDSAFGLGLRSPVIDREVIGCVDNAPAERDNLALVIVLHAAARSLELRV
jgi:hypothetical protein